MADFDDESIDTIITDPPYGWEFMGKDWDKGVPGVPYWAEMLRVCKPGAFLMAFGGPRTYHRLACAIEDAGWEIRDCIQYLFGSGFPKSHNISKNIDKAARRDYVAAAISLGLEIPGNSLHDWTKAEHSPSDKWWNKFKSVLTNEQWESIEREIIGNNNRKAGWFTGRDGHDITAPATPDAQLWDGYGTALKPAVEMIAVAMKPLDGTFAHNALTHGVAGLNIDECRIAVDPVIDASQLRTLNRSQRVENSNEQKWGMSKNHGDTPQVVRPEGRFPANVILTHTEDCGENCAPDCPVRLLDEQSGVLKSNPIKKSHKKGKTASIFGMDCQTDIYEGSEGGASRFFYTAKAHRGEREHGLIGKVPCYKCGGLNTKTHVNENGETVNCIRNDHPTVKPISIMEYLCKLTKTPTGGVILDPFAGSGTTRLAAMRTGREFILIDKEERNCLIARNREDKKAASNTQKEMALC